MITEKPNSQTEPPAGRPGWPEVMAYRAWKMWAVRVALAIVVLAAVFGLGAWYGRSTGAGHVRGPAHAPAPPAGEQVLYWTCSMHLQIRLPAAGKCPICRMDLIPVRAGRDTGGPDTPRLTLSKRARELARVETSVVEARHVSVDVRMVGKIMPDETRITYISSYIPGRIDRLFVDYTGILVHKGDHLAEIYSPELLIAQREYLLGLEAVERAARTADNDSEKAAAGALLEASRRKLELWGIPADELERLARERRPSDHMRIDAPLEGWVIERNAYQGMYVETGTRIFTLADLRTVWVMLDAYELDIGCVRLGQEVEFETEAFPGQLFQGRVAYVDPVLNPATRTVKVRVNVDNPDTKLRPEMFVRARLKARLGPGGSVVEDALAGKWLCPMHPEVVKDGPETCDRCGMNLVPAETLGYLTRGAPPAKVLTVPQTAVLLTGRRAVVYVERLIENGTPVYEGREIRLGPRAGEYYVVEAGLSEGERVVTRGAIMIDSALQIQARPSMMQPASQPAETTRPARQEASAGRPATWHYVPGAMYHRDVAAVIGAYLDHVSALAADDENGAAVALGNLRKALAGAAPHGLEGEAASAFQSALTKIGDSLPKGQKASIDDMRIALPKLTAALADYLRAFGHDREGPLYRLHCPMAFDNRGADWLQADERVNNPYFGRRMLRCGELTGRIGPDGKEGL